MADRRFEMHPDRQVIVHMRQGDADRGIARTAASCLKRTSIAGRWRSTLSAKAWARPR